MGNWKTLKEILYVDELADARIFFKTKNSPLIVNIVLKQK